MDACGDYKHVETGHMQACADSQQILTYRLTTYTYPPAHIDVNYFTCACLTYTISLRTLFVGLLVYDIRPLLNKHKKGQTCGALQWEQAFATDAHAVIVDGVAAAVAAPDSAPTSSKPS